MTQALPNQATHKQFFEPGGADDSPAAPAR
jgi:hypothetical protein